MTVAELIAELEKHNKDEIVYVGEGISDAESEFRIWEKHMGKGVPEGLYLISEE